MARLCSSLIKIRCSDQPQMLTCVVFFPVDTFEGVSTSFRLRFFPLCMHSLMCSVSSSSTVLKLSVSLIGWHRLLLGRPRCIFPRQSFLARLSFPNTFSRQKTVRLSYVSHLYRRPAGPVKDLFLYSPTVR